MNLPLKREAVLPQAKRNTLLIILVLVSAFCGTSLMFVTGYLYGWDAAQSDDRRQTESDARRHVTTRPAPLYMEPPKLDPAAAYLCDPAFTYIPSTWTEYGLPANTVWRPSPKRKPGTKAARLGDLPVSP